MVKFTTAAWRNLLRKFGMQATFFLISGQLGIRVPFYRYGEDTVVERVSAAKIPATYCGMEVASHTQFHRLPQEEKEIRREMEESLAVLSRACGYVVCGMAYPGGHCAQAQADTLRRMGLTYARLTEPTHDFAPPGTIGCNGVQPAIMLTRQCLRCWSASPRPVGTRYSTFTAILMN